LNLPSQVGSFPEKLRLGSGLSRHFRKIKTL
jgi:hypothetical protein